MDLVASLREGDPRAVAEAFAQHRARVFSFLFRLSRRRAIAEELTQETFLRLARHARSLAADTDLCAWLYAVARNAWVSHRRVAMFDLGRFVELDEQYVGTPADVDDRADARRRLRAVERALDAVSESDREVLVLCAVEGREPADAANVLGVRADAVRQRLLRARARLARAMELAALAAMTVLYLGWAVVFTSR